MHYRLLICTAALALGSQAALANRVDLSSFATCEEAKAAVAKAGGLFINRQPDPVFATRSCGRDYDSDRVSVFEEKHDVGGQKCLIGYSCIKTSSDAGR